jgi:type IV pilus assembly protein PilM
VAGGEERSFWKKEIRLLPRRKRDRAGYLAPEKSEPETSFWKKEISFSRKAKVEPPAPKVEVHEESHGQQPVAQTPPAAPPPAAPAPVAPQPVAQTPPVAPQPAAPAPAAPQPAAPPPAASQPPASISVPSADDSDEHTLVFELDSPPEKVEPRPTPIVRAVPSGPFGEISPAPPSASPRPPIEPPVELPRRPVAIPVAEETHQVDPPAAVQPLPSPPAAVEPPPPAPAAVQPLPPAPRVITPEEAKVEAETQEPKKRLSRAEKKARQAAEKERRRRGSKAKKIVGLKIGASQLAAARVSNNGSAELLQVARQPLDPGIVVAGELRDPESLAKALKAFFKKNKLPTRGVRIGLSNNRIGVRIFEIGGIHEPEQLKNAIRFRAQETLPIPIEEAVLDYHVLDERVDENGDLTRRVLLVVAYRDLVERYVAACRKAGLRLVGVDLEAFALLRALGKAPSEHSSEDRNGLVVVSVGHDRSTFAVSDGRACEFTRVLDWGGFSLNVAIARALDLTPSQSEQIKLGLSLTDKTVVPQGLASEQADTARAVVLRALEAFARDLVSSLRFYQSQPDSLGIRELVLTGGTAAMPGLASEVERLIGVSVRVGDPLGRVKVSKRVKHGEQVGSLAAAIGLGIED